MLPAFVLATFTFASVVTFVLDHILGLGFGGLVVAGIACVVLEIALPGTVPFIRALFSLVMRGFTWLITTTAGAFVIVAAGAFFAGFWGHSFLDRSVELQKRLEAQVEATNAANAAATLARTQALALGAVNAAANRRAEAAEAKVADDEEQLAELAAQFKAQDQAAAKATKKPVRSYALTAASAAALNRIGAPLAATRH